MKVLKYILKIFLLLVVIVISTILLSGKWYVFNVLQHTVLKGRLGPTITEYKKDYLQVIATKNVIEIPAHKLYNKQKLNQNFTHYVNDLGTVSFVVLKNDSIIHEEYWDGWNADSLSNSYSMAKSFVSLLVGCAIHDGLIKSVDDGICNYLPDFNCDKNSTVTIKHLLTMSSAIDFNESYINPFVYAAEALYSHKLKDATYNHVLVGEPGKKFDYESGNTQLLCLIVEKVTGKKLADYASEKLWTKMGANKNAYWSLDSENGLARAFCCFISNAKDFARFGILLNHQGNFYGTQLVDSAYIKAALTPASQLIDEEGKICNKYGFQFWMLDYKGLKINYCRGILGQYIVSIPQKNIVAVRLGHKRSKEKKDGHPIDLFKIIDQTLELCE